MTTEAELMNQAAEPVVYSNVYYGKCLMTFWEGKFPRDENNKITGKPIRWYEGDDPKSRMIMIDVMLDLAPGCTSNYPVQISCPKHDKDWQKIVLPSIVEAGAVRDDGVADFSKVKDHWVKVEQVEGTRPRDKNNPDKGCWNTYKFLAIYDSKEACLAAMAEDNGDDVPAEKPAAAKAKKTSKNDEGRKAAIEFCRAVVAGYKGQDAATIRSGIASFIESNPNAKPYITVDDPEIAEMIEDAAIPF